MVLIVVCSTYKTTSGWTSRNGILDTIRDLGFEVGVDEDRNEKDLDGWEVGGCPVLGEVAPCYF